MRLQSLPFVLAGLSLVLLQPLRAAPAQVSFTQSAETVDAFDFVEVTLAVAQPDAPNPFTDAMVTGEFASDGAAPLTVDGFCDATDGRVFRIRFMPTAAGRHTLSVRYRQGDFERTHTGAFTARDVKRRADQGFTVIQAVVLAELDGLNTPNAYGHTPLVGNDPAKPNEEYFKHVGCEAGESSVGQGREWVLTARHHAIGTRHRLQDQENTVQAKRLKKTHPRSVQFSGASISWQ